MKIRSHEYTNKNANASLRNLQDFLNRIKIVRNKFVNRGKKNPQLHQILK